MNTSKVKDELDRECTKNNVDTALKAQEQLRREMNDRISRQAEILQNLQSCTHDRGAPTGITSPVKKLLDLYEELDDTNRQALWISALATNNVDLQCALFALRDNKKNAYNRGTQAKLAKELIKLAVTYKVPEL